MAKERVRIRARFFIFVPIMKRVLIIGGTSGIGRELARTYLRQGCRVGVTGRREQLLESLQQEALGGELQIRAFDVTREQVCEDLAEVVSAMQGVDLCIYAAGYGFGNLPLDPTLETNAVSVNVQAFVRVVTWFFHYWNSRGQAGHFAVISSIAGIRPLGVAPGYSATKHFQAFYLKTLRQLAVARRSKICFSSIHPGFVDTDFIKGHRYPMTMSVEKAVQAMVRGLRRRRKTIIVDGRWRMIAALMHLIPAALWTRLGVFFRGSERVFPHD